MFDEDSLSDVAFRGCWLAVLSGSEVGRTKHLTVKAQKKYSPPHPLDTKGCCSPQNNPKKSSLSYCLSFQGISNDLFVDCTNRFSCILQDVLFFHQTIVIYWRAECWDGVVGWRFEYISSVELLSGVLSVTDTN
jgi:hypothetical protein